MENKRAKIKFELRLADNIKNDSKSFYAYVRSKQRNKVKVGPLKDNQRCIISDSKDMAETPNNYFISVFTMENLSNIPKVSSYVDFSDTEVLRDLEIEESEVEEKLMSTIASLANDTAKANELKENISKLGNSNADEIIANEILKTLNG